MKVMVVTSSPNKNGLTANCGIKARLGAAEANAEITSICLNDLSIDRCHACGSGWGTCNKEHECQVLDDFQTIHKLMAQMDAYIIITPVYWGDMSEVSKSFFDRLRRCEASTTEKNIFEGKPVISVAAAGGTGGGTLSCLSTMDRLFSHIKLERFDLISITKKSKDYKLDTIQKSSKAMVEYVSQNKNNTLA